MGEGNSRVLCRRRVGYGGPIFLKVRVRAGLSCALRWVTEMLIRDLRGVLPVRRVVGGGEGSGW